MKTRGGERNHLQQQQSVGSAGQDQRHMELWGPSRAQEVQSLV